MEFIHTAIPDVIIIKPDVYRDQRGFFLEFYNERKYREGGIDTQFIQDNHSHSGKGTLRGLHAQLSNTQGKLIRVILGEIMDVAVDARPSSPTFGRWVSAIMSAENHQQLYIPRGFLHGFCVISDMAEVEYKCDNLYDPKSEISVAWDDPDIAIEWPISDPILSSKDKTAPSFAEAKERFAVYK